MSSYIKRSLNDLTNENKRLKDDSAIDLNYDIKKSQSSYSTSTSSGRERNLKFKIEYFSLYRIIV